MDHNLEKLSMLDEHGHRLRLYPAEVSGFFRKHRTWTQIVLCLFFLILPWTKMNGVQSLLIDLPNRRFAIFGLTFFAHDGPLIFFILAILTLGLAFMTAVWGRVWCGWGCPQTVFIDGVFRRIEFWIEGNHLKRRALDQAEFSFEYLFKKIIKWILFLFASSLIAHSFIAYFVGAEELVRMTSGNPKENWLPFLFVTVITLIILFDFGWFREQFCIIVCPYGRFQSVLQDRQSVTVVYDESRGEPRKGSADYATKKGDCVSCSRCIQVCPTGIDIRNGIQMECIACTACIDACDEIMEKVHKPKGLIRYNSLDNTKANAFRPRTLIYLALIFFSVVGLTYKISTREDHEVFILRGKEAPYQKTITADGKELLINHMRLHLSNQTFKEKTLTITEPENWKELGIQLTTPETVITLGPGEFKMIHFFITLPPDLVKGLGQYKTKLNVDTISKEFTLVGPAK